MPTTFSVVGPSTGNCALFHSIASLMRVANAAWGMFDLICDSATVEPHRTWELEVSSQDLEGLMVDMLTDMLVLSETDGMLASSVEVDVTMVEDQWRAVAKVRRAVAKVRGEPYDGDRHELLHDIKAATYHTLEVRPDEGPSCHLLGDGEADPRGRPCRRHRKQGEGRGY